MSITVEHGKDNITIHTKATRWHVDEDERLHIIGPNGNLASYNRGYWANVVQGNESGSTPTTAVATLYRKESQGEDNVTLSFNADYSDDRNKKWAKYTPALSLGMNVIDSVAEQFEEGSRYLLTFEKQD